jgi:hypothetical protein
VKQYSLPVPPVAMQRAIVRIAMLAANGVDGARRRCAATHALKRSILEQVGRG